MDKRNINRRKADAVRVLAVKNTAQHFKVSEVHVRNIDLYGAKTLEAEGIKKWYDAEYTRIQSAALPVGPAQTTAI